MECLSAEGLASNQCRFGYMGGEVWPEVLKAPSVLGLSPIHLFEFAGRRDGLLVGGLLLGKRLKRVSVCVGRVLSLSCNCAWVRRDFFLLFLPIE